MIASPFLLTCSGASWRNGATPTMPCYESGSRKGGLFRGMDSIRAQYGVGKTHPSPDTWLYESLGSKRGRVRGHPLKSPLSRKPTISSERSARAIRPSCSCYWTSNKAVTKKARSIKASFGLLLLLLVLLPFALPYEEGLENILRGVSKILG